MDMESIINGLLGTMANSLTHSLTRSLTPLLRCKLSLVIPLTSV